MLLQKDLMCWIVEQSDVSWASVSINTKYCIVKTTDKILSVTEKIADNKLENIITEMLYPACKRIMCNLQHITHCLAGGVWCIYPCLQSHCLVFPSEQLTLGYFWKSTHLIYHHFVARQRYHRALKLLSIAGPKFLFLNERVRQFVSGEGIALRIRQLSVALAKQISSLQLTEFLVTWGRFYPVPGSFSLAECQVKISRD